MRLRVVSPVNFRLRSRPCQLAGGHRIALSQQTERNTLALGELVGLICLGDEIDDLRLEDAPAHRDLNAVVRFDQLRRRATLREQHLEELVEATALTLHQL